MYGPLFYRKLTVSFEVMVLVQLLEEWFDLKDINDQG